MSHLLTLAHTIHVPDTFTPSDANVSDAFSYRVFPDDCAEDPRNWIPAKYAGLYAYRTPAHGSSLEGKPEGNIALDAFARFYDVLPNEDHAFAATVRWLNIYHPDAKYQLGMQTIRGYSQGDWLDVFVAVEEGYGTPDSLADEIRMWAFGDVWTVVRSDGDSLLGIYADTSEAALAQYREQEDTSVEEPTPISQR